MTEQMHWLIRIFAKNTYLKVYYLMAWLICWRHLLEVVLINSKNIWVLLCDFQPWCICPICRKMSVCISILYDFNVYTSSQACWKLCDCYVASTDLDQTVHMCNLIWIYTSHKCLKVGVQCSLVFSKKDWKNLNFWISEVVWESRLWLLTCPHSSNIV